MSARPYPTELEETVQLASGRTVTLRPILPEDEAEHLDLLHNLSLEDTRWRFFAPVRDMDHIRISRYTCIDYDTEMAFIATRQKEDGRSQTLGVVRAAILG
ncbi:MAG TPA: GNAT family N-acetyltransferase, partial [Magnetovibrio sp.]